MRLRTALKIRKAIGTERESRYTGDQLDRALSRFEQTESFRYNLRFMNALMDRIGPEGRAYLLRNHKPAAALRILCEQCEGLSFTKGESNGS